jgi:O-methyltransferase involved in polyketide biosynthesis
MSNELVGIPETLLIALWARAAASQEDNPIICDEKAIEMVSQIDYDFSRFGTSKMTKLGVAVRTTLLDKALGDFLKKHPYTVIVNFGAGLDTRHARMKYDNIDWFEIDVPKSIELRRKFFSETSHYHFIDQSIFDLSWTEKIKTKGRNVLFLAEGLFMYFTESKLKPFFCKLAEKFPDSQMFFEMLAPFAVGKSKRHETVRKIDSSAEFKWGLKNSRDMEQWHPAIKIIEEWEYFDYYKKRWGLLGKIARLPIIRPHLACRIVHLHF